MSKILKKKQIPIYKLVHAQYLKKQKFSKIFFRLM